MEGMKFYTATRLLLVLLTIAWLAIVALLIHAVEVAPKSSTIPPHASWEYKAMDGIDCMYDQFTDPTTEEEVQALTVVCDTDGYEWSMSDYEYDPRESGDWLDSGK